MRRLYPLALPLAPAPRVCYTFNMTDLDDPLQDESGRNTMLHDALEALRRQDLAKARDLLTRLIKADQNKAEYWLWLSAAMGTQKERIYCLQTALKLEPNNAAAKRGLILMGALPPDEKVKPFPINRPRAWEDELLKPPPQEKHASQLRKPVMRLLMVIGIGVVVLGMVVGLFMLPRSPLAGLRPDPTRRFTRTPSPTVTMTPEVRTATPTFAAPTPLWMLLDSTYTPTPVYVVTEHPVTSRDAFDAAMRAYSRGEYADTIILMEQILTMEPQAADAWYYIGECRRMLGAYTEARAAYQEAINLNPALGPAYLGRALAKQSQGVEDGVQDDLNRAIQIDPNYDAAYVYRGIYWLENYKPEQAVNDLSAATTMNPNNALGFTWLAKAQLTLGLNEEALASAQKANALDATLLEAYLVLGEAYDANGQPDEALGALQTYTLYQPDNLDAMIYLGSAYNHKGEYSAAVDILTRVIALDKNNVEANYQRGLAYFNMGSGDQAVHDLRVAYGYDPKHYGAAFTLARAYALNGFAGNAYIQMEAALGLADTPAEKAACFYYEALFAEEMQDAPTAQSKWENLLKLPESAMPQEWRDTALARLGVTATPTKFFTLTPVMTLTTNTPVPTP